MTSDPAELHDGIVELLDGVSNLRRHLSTLRHQYLALKPETLGVDDLGPAMSVPGALAAIHQGLIGIDEALRFATDASYDTMRHTSRLKVDTLKHLEDARAAADFALTGDTAEARKISARILVKIARQDGEEPEPWVLAVAEGRLNA
ncbi:hypothetical protein [Tsukamurella paurometabola]|uniref:Uncharacterized protein n=1 Tax=Tsukamurella paurometabola TaxID=2061 RepID=A0ABS5NFY9_TSUPA|nr:hypothetical protein [Tsukamurella paurometabola]MBS4102777.1 hypothetical protein [Tsukamurella paurometabola]